MVNRHPNPSEKPCIESKLPKKSATLVKYQSNSNNDFNLTRPTIASIVVKKIEFARNRRRNAPRIPTKMQSNGPSMASEPGSPMAQRKKPVANG
jgi:hypothetical protein